MKIEKINDNQIRCTLSSEDLHSRNIRLSELAYGSAKAKQLFQDMMQEAHYEFGFDSGNSPLMIEAIPTASGSITLIITKVDDPEELDARFSRFTQSADETAKPADKLPIGADEILDLFHKLYEEEPSGKSAEKPVRQQKLRQESVSGHAELVQTFLFHTLEDTIQAAKDISGHFSGRNTLYKNLNGDGYRLMIYQSGNSPVSFNQVCNVLSEYGEGSAASTAMTAYYAEHGDALIKNRALQKLAQI